jgi:hypothetical protein
MGDKGYVDEAGAELGVIEILNSTLKQKGS